MKEVRNFSTYFKAYFKAYFKPYLLVGLGCFLGADCRYVMEKILEIWISNNMAILVINLLGCWFIGLLSGYIYRNFLHPHLISLLVGGFCGGFTTFSSMVFYLVSPLEQGEYGIVLMYLGLNILGGMVVCYLGLLWQINREDFKGL